MGKSVENRKTVESDMVAKLKKKGIFRAGRRKFKFLKTQHPILQLDIRLAIMETTMVFIITMRQ